MVCAHATSRGFTFVELALTLAVAGLVLAGMAMQGRPSQKASPADAGLLNQVAASQGEFFRRNGRLPCADTDGDGYEGGPSGCGGVTENRVGAIPYKTLGMTPPSHAGSPTERKFIYGVYRGTSAMTDLTQNVERTGDSPDEATYANIDDLRYALVQAAALGFDAGQIHVTGNDTGSGASVCGSNRVGNMAYVVVYAGMRDADRNGKDFDGAHNGLAWPSGGGVTCFVGPGKPVSERYDDTVQAVGFSELLGALSR